MAGGRGRRSTEPRHDHGADRRRVGRPNGPHRHDRNPACLTSQRAGTRPRIIIDCDPGHDDAIAIVVAAHACDLAGITTVAGNAPLDRTTHNALVMRELLGIDVPVHAGAARPLLAEPFAAADVHGASGLDGAGASRADPARRLRRRRRLHHRDLPQPARDVDRRRRPADERCAGAAPRPRPRRLASPGSR